MPKSDIAIIMPRFSRYGGAEGFAYRLAEALAGRGHGVDFICARAEVAPPAGVRLRTVGRFGGLRAVKTAWFAWAAERVRRQGDYAVTFGLGKSVNQDILREGGGPLGGFWKHSRRAWPAGWPRFWKMLRRRLSPVNWIISSIDSKRYRNAGQIVAVSEFLRELLLAEYPDLDPARIRVIYNKPDLERFARPSQEDRDELRARSGFGPDDTVLTFAGTNFRLKGLGGLIRALARLDEKVYLVVAGGRNPSRYIRLADSLGVGGRVRFLGRVEDMAPFYAMGDVFVLPSFYDACSNAVLEALACGSRVISSAQNGSSYFLPSSNVLADPGDVDALAAMLKSVAAQPAPAPFVWPQEAACGLEPYIEMIETMLQKRKDY